MLIPTRYDASATVSPGRHSTKRVTPSSKLSAILCPITSFSCPTPDLDVIDVDDVVDVVVLEDDLLAFDHRPCGTCVECVDGRTEICIHSLVAVAVRHPIEAKMALSAALRDNLDVADVVGCTRLRQTGGA